MHEETNNADAPLKQGTAKALSEIKDQAILLEMASEYLCQEPFLKQIGVRLEKNLSYLEKAIESLKDQSLKPVQDPQMDAQIKELNQVAVLLKKPGKETQHRCKQGEIAKIVGRSVAALGVSIRDLSDKLHHSTVSYGLSDSLQRFFGNFKILVTGLSATSKFAFKIIGVFLLLLSASVVFLSLTMDSKRELERDVSQYTAKLNNKNELLAKIGTEYETMRADIERLRQMEATREGEIEIMDLSVESYKVLQQKETVEVEASLIKETLDKKKKKLDEIDRKGLLKRLLRL